MEDPPRKLETDRSLNIQNKIKVNIYMSSLFTKFFRLLWVLFFGLLIFLDRDIFIVKVGLIIFLLILTVITIIRTLESKREWGEIIEDIENSVD